MIEKRKTQPLRLGTHRPRPTDLARYHVRPLNLSSGWAVWDRNTGRIAARFDGNDTRELASRLAAKMNGLSTRENDVA